MKIDRKLQQHLAEQAWVSSEVNGGVSATNMQVKESGNGIGISIATPSLNDAHYRLELQDNRLILYTSYGQGRLNEEGQNESPTTVRVFPIISRIDTEKIDAVFEGETLRIFLPFLPDGKETPKREINIRTRYKY